MAKLGFAEIDKAFRESGLSNSEIDKASTKFLINPAYKDATKDDLEKYIADYKDNLGLHDITETTVEAAATKEVDETSNRKGFDVYMVTHKDVMNMYDESAYKTYVSEKAISNFEGTTMEEWNNYIFKTKAKNRILDFMNEANKEFDGKVPASKTVEKHIAKLIKNDIPLMKVEKYNGKVYYKLRNCIDGRYYVRIPYEKVRELVVSTSNNALKICAVMTYLCDEKTSKMEKVYKNGKVYFTISRECVAKAIGLSSNSNRGLDDIGITLTSLCNLGFLERFKEAQKSKDGNTYKSIYSYRITTLEEYRQAKKRGTIE